MSKSIWLVPLLLALLPKAASAHSGELLAAHDLWAAWQFAPTPTLALAGLALVYLQAVANLWHTAGPGHGVRCWQVGAFLGGLLLLAVALLSPLDSLADALFSAHMVQHVLLMMAAAPLLALGAPAHIWLWVLPVSARRGGARWLHRRSRLRSLLRSLRSPAFVLPVSAAVMWLWHIPAWYEAALADETLHALEHGAFLASAWLFWLAVLKPRRRGLLADGSAILLLFITALHSDILGALITFAPRPWIPSYMLTTAAWGLMPLADQQLAGVIMWAPAGLVYLGAILALIGMRLARLERQDADSRHAQFDPRVITTAGPVAPPRLMLLPGSTPAHEEGS